MSEASSEEEPSIEEILASIRQIISDDEEEEPAGETAESAPAPEPEPEAEQEPEEDVLELTDDMREEPAAEEPPEPEPEIEEEIEVPLPEPVEIDLLDPEDDEPVSNNEDIISDVAKEAALASMSKLTGSMPVTRRSNYDGVTLEDIIRELLHPMLREWVDANLPSIVERQVQKELEKLARKAMDD